MLAIVDIFLYIASQEGHANIAEFLVVNGAFVDTKDDSGWTALHIASLNGNTAVVRFLVHNGASINASNKGSTPLCLATRQGHDETIEILLNKGAIK